ncbi:hypothetical protein T492DRAFT_1046746 [Pavlovales sp. CCMP2436]|nr:hypothetical protein T492DRAFT_1046746 [Pavlovales sp. CCMP2436]
MRGRVETDTVRAGARQALGTRRACPSRKCHEYRRTYTHHVQDTYAALLLNRSCFSLTTHRRDRHQTSVMAVEKATRWAMKS